MKASPATVSRLLAAAGHVKSVVSTTRIRGYHDASYGFEVAGVRGADGKFIHGAATVEYNSRLGDTPETTLKYLARYAETLAPNFSVVALPSNMYGSGIRLCVRPKE